MSGEISAADHEMGDLAPRLEELRQALENETESAQVDTTVADARAAYLATLPALYKAERAAGLPSPAAPGDPNAPKNAYAKGVRTKVEARIVSVTKGRTRTEVVFVRGKAADPLQWTEEVEAVLEGDVPLVAGSVVTLDAVFTAGQTPAWRILGAAEKK